MSILSFLKNIKNISNIRISIEYKGIEKPTDHLVSKRIPFLKAKPKPKLAQTFDAQGQCLHVNYKIDSHSSETRYFNNHQYIHDTITYCCKDCGKKNLSASDIPSTTDMSFSSPIFEDDQSSWGVL